MREAADHRARSRFTDEIRALQTDRWHIVDLGCGAGSNLRYLAPMLGVRQHWVCIDNDSNLLAAIADYATTIENCSAVTVQADLAKDIRSSLAAALSDADKNAVRLISASALLDLVSTAWIDALVTACADTRVAALFALTYDGRIELSPAHPRDNELRTLVNAHQLNDKGFGPALGPGAAQYARKAFEQCGYRVIEAQTDWRLNVNDHDLQRELLAGWVSAAHEQSRDRHALARWHEHRLARIDSGDLSVRVGHRDLLAIPADAVSTT